MTTKPHSSSIYDWDDEPTDILEAVKAQSHRYGRQIRELELNDKMEDRNRVRKAWRNFNDQLPDALWWFARAEYTNAYLGKIT